MSLRVALLLDPLSMYLEEPLSLRVKWGDHAGDLARELLGRGITVRGFGAPPGLIPRSGEDASPEAGERPTLRRGRGGRIRKFRPDVLVAYDALSPAAARGARIAQKIGAALVLVEAALPPDDRPIERARNRLGRMLWGPYVRRHTDALVALDPAAEALAFEDGFRKEIVSVVPHGVDVARYRPGLTSTLVARHRIVGRILLYVGRLSPNRGLEVLLTAFARTVGQRADWSLVLAGDGPSRPRLRAMAGRLGVGARVHWLARPRKEELPGLLGTSTLLAVPARDSSVMGKNVVRGLACGIPVLASDLPRLRHLVMPAQGVLAAPGDVASWTEAIRQAAGSPVARKRWSQNARAFAESRLAWPVVTDRIEEILHEALQRARGKGRDAGEPRPREKPGDARAG